MVNRVGGLASGMDIDALVEKLMNAERAPLNKLYQNKQRYEWQRDAYRNINTKLKTFDTYIADNLMLKNLTSKTATSSNSAYVSAVATGTASGTLSIDGVSQLATAARGVGQQINATGSTKLSELGIGETSIELKAIQSDGSMATKATKIEFDPNTTTVDQLISKINSSNAGVSAIFEGGKVSITAKNTGDNKVGAEVQVTSGADVFNKLGFKSLTGQSGDLASGGTNAVFEVNGIATERTTNSFTINGYTLTLKETFNASTTITNKLEAAQKERDNAYASLYEDVKDKDGNIIKFSLENAVQNANNAYSADIINAYQTKLTEVLGSSKLDETEQAVYTKFKNKDFLSKLSDQDIAQLGPFTVNPDATREEMLAAISSSLDDELSPELKEKLHTLSKEELIALSNLDSAQLTDLRTEVNREIKQNNYNTISKSFLNGLTSEEITAIQAIDFTKEDPYEGLTISDDLKTKLNGLSGAERTALDNLTEQDLKSFKELAAVQIPHDEKKSAKEAADAALAAGQTRLTNAEATLKAAQEAAANPPTSAAIASVTLTSSNNVDDMMAKIKEFVNTYNGLIKDLSDQTKQSKYRDYTPLTNEQKEDMSENEIKLWEEKAKSGLLRNDTLIRSGLADMRSLVYQSNPAITDSKYNTLYSIGITTSKNYNEGGTLQIDETKLRAALEADPDAVEKLFKNSEGKKEDTVNGETVDTRGYLEKLRESMKSFEISIEKKAGRSTMTDAEYVIGKNLMDTENRIDTWKRKLEDIETRYWKQFTAMETAINKANQQSSMFMQGQ